MRTGKNKGIKMPSYGVRKSKINVHEKRKYLRLSILFSGYEIKLQNKPTHPFESIHFSSEGCTRSSIALTNVEHRAGGMAQSAECKREHGAWVLNNCVTARLSAVFCNTGLGKQSRMTLGSLPSQSSSISERQVSSSVSK